MNYLDFVDKYGNLSEVEKNIINVSRLLGNAPIDCFEDKIKNMQKEIEELKEGKKNLQELLEEEY